MAKERYTERTRPQRQAKKITSARKSPLFRVATGTGLALALGAAGALHFVRKSPDTLIKTPKTTPITSPAFHLPTPASGESGLNMLRDERQIDRIITNLDRGMSTIYEALKAKLVNADLKEREYLLAPLEYYFRNAQNKDRNQARVTHGGMELAQKDSSGFFINGVFGNSSVIAAYAPQYGSLLVPPNFDSTNLYDISIAYHESEHALQHENRISGTDPVKLDSYFNHLYTLNSKNVLGFDEVDAYAHQIHMINVLSDNKLKTDVLSGHLDIDEWRTSMNSRPEQDHDMGNLFRMAQQLYTYQTQVNVIPPEFKKGIYDWILEPGETIIEFNSHGELVPANNN